MKKCLILFLSVFYTLTLSAQQGITYKTIKEISYYEQSADSYIKERCKIDFYYPENSDDFATVIWFHGGGLSGGEKFIPQELTNSGLAVVAVNYRLLPHVNFVSCIEDAAQAVAWTFNNIEHYGGDRNKIFVSGHSAGGYLAAMLGMDKRWLAKHSIDADSIAAVISFSGHAISHFAYRQTLGMKDTQPSIDEFAPIYYVRADAPPFVIVSGDREMELLGRYEENAYFWRMMKVVGHPYTYIYELDGYDHGDMATPAFHIMKHHIRDLIKE